VPVGCSERRLTLRLSSSDIEEIKKLSSSPSFLKLADSILASLDRDTLAEVLAGYTYFRSEKRSNLDFALYMVTRRFGKVVTVTINVIAAVIPGLLFDKEFRSVIFAAISTRKSFAKKEEPEKSVSLRHD
jgi:hypothetical protein